MANPLSVLLVESSSDDESLIVSALRRGGFDPTWKRVDNAAAMRAALLPPSWDVILTDYALPSFGAPDALALMAEMGITLPFIIVSGTTGEEFAVEAMRSGANDYLLKTRLDQLPAAIERAIRDTDARSNARHTEEVLRRNRIQLATSQRIAHMGSWEIELPHDTVTWSDEMYRILGRDPGDTAPSLELLQQCIHPDDRATVLAARDQARNLNRRFFCEYRLQRGDETVWVQERGEPISDDSGNLVRIVGTTQDVTELKQIHEQLIVSDRMASVGTLAAGVAHEINNPLAAVVANLDLAMREVEDLSPGNGGLAVLKDELNDAREAAERLRVIVRDMKIFSRAEEDKREAVDLKRVVESSLRMAWNEIRHRARVERNYGETPPVEASESRLGQVFLNLIVNAAQAIPDGRVADNLIRVSTGCDAEGRVFATVSDTGPGIPPELLNKIFTPFFTTKPKGVGTGLGLPICQRIVSDLGGEISVQSELGTGSVFRVTLPPGRFLPAGDVASADEGATAQRRGRVLVVDDEPLIVTAVQRTLAAEHDVTGVTSAIKALALIEAGNRYDVILCDLMMPQMTGVDLHEQLARSAPEQAARMIFVTGGAFTPRARVFLDEVPNQRLDKPFAPQQLRTLVNDRVR